LISAPSGFGKTTFLNEWREHCKAQVAWAILDPDDDAPLRFWSVVAMALQTLNASAEHTLISQRHTLSQSDLSSIVINLTNDIVHLLKELHESPGIGLVLENYHHIKNPEIHTSLQSFLEHLPPKFNLIISSQAKPPLDLGRLRFKGIVGELGVDDLRFTLEEGLEFLSRHISTKNLASGDRQKLVKRTEGWITGLLLAIGALAQEDEPARFVETFTGAHPHLREFFYENVLFQQLPEMQIFLLKTSILKHLNGPLCDAVAGGNDSTNRLAHLWEERLFLEHLDQPDWYRYHGLFAEMLQAHLEEHMRAEIPDLHRRAAAWYVANNASADAVHHLLASQAWEEAADLIESIALQELEKFGEGPLVLRWLQQLPELVLHQHEALLLLYIRLATLYFPPAEVERILTHAEVSINLRSAADKTGDAHQVLAEIHRVHRLWITNARSGSKLTSNGRHATVYQMMDNILQFQREYQGDLLQAETKANAVYKTARARHHLFGILIAGGACAHLAFSRGQLQRSEQIAHQVLRQAIELKGHLPEPASIALTALSGVYFERNQFGQARQLFERAIEVDPDPISTNESVAIAILRAKIQSIQEDSDASIVTIQTAREQHAQRPSTIWHDQDLVAYQALFHLHQGDIESAEQLLREGWEIDTHPFSAFVRASILTDQNRYVAAEDILRRLLDRYPYGFYWVPSLRVQAKLALVLFAQQKVNEARQVMAEAARIAAPEFFIRPFLFTSPQVASLLSLVLHTENLNPGTRSFLKGTLTRLGYAEGLQNILPREESVDLAIAASITPREQHMLRLLSASLSNQEIAEQCSISPSTVKTHLENIYRKLGVSSRTQAVEQARMLNLV
jgi:LuxR family maltose regulon positive regulatory protein